MSTIQIIEKLKSQRKLGDYVRIEDGMILLRSRTPREGYKNYLRVRAAVFSYRRSLEDGSTTSGRTGKNE